MGAIDLSEGSTRPSVGLAKARARCRNVPYSQQKSGGGTFTRVNPAALLAIVLLTLTPALMALGCQTPTSGDDTGASRRDTPSEAIPDAGPFGMSAQPLVTTNSGAAYISQCQLAGVPVPTQVTTQNTNSLGWVNHGALAPSETRVSPSLTAEVWSWRSTSPRGLCVALPRINLTSNKIQFFGLICMGQETSQVCYFDNPRFVEADRNVAIPISWFVGGAALVANDQGVCSDCHSGDNPWVNHPNAPAFASLRSMRADVYHPRSWPEPIVPAGMLPAQLWTQNAGPLLGLDPMVGMGEQRCDGCHIQGNGGRFPIPSSNLTPGYCGTVLASALNGFGSFTRTMPPSGPNAASSAHAVALGRFCNVTLSLGGVQQGMGPPDVPGVLSPPMIVEPFYSCGGVIGVQGARFGALVELRRSGSTTVVASAISRGSVVEFPLASLGPLGISGTWTATQKVGSTTSGPSRDATARNLAADYPAGLPAPRIDPTLIYVAGQGVGVSHVAGVQLEIRRTNVGVTTTRLWDASSYPYAFAEADAVFAAQNTVAVRQRCGVGGTWSAVSPSVTVQTAPASLNPGPIVRDNRIFEGQSIVDVIGLTESNRLEFGPYTSRSWPTSAIWADVGLSLGRAFLTTDSFAVRQRLGTATSTTATVVPRPCAQLPLARAAAPSAGTDILNLTDIVPGSTLRVTVSGTEIGDGSGPVIRLTRNVTSGELLLLTQEFPTCRASQHFAIQVP